MTKNTVASPSRGFSNWNESIYFKTVDEDPVEGKSGASSRGNSSSTSVD